MKIKDLNKMTDIEKALTIQVRLKKFAKENEITLDEIFKILNYRENVMKIQPTKNWN
jgi:hypothetical protein